MAHARFAAEIIFRRTGGITSSHNIQVTGSAIGIAAAITSGADTIVGSSTGPGSSSTSDSLPGGRMGTRTIITLTTTIRISTATTRVITIPAFTKTKSITGKITTVMPTPTRPLLPRSSDSRGKVIIADKSTELSVLKHSELLRVTKAATDCASPAL